MNIMFDLDSTLVRNDVTLNILTKHLLFHEAYELIHNMDYDFNNIPQPLRQYITDNMNDIDVMTSFVKNPYADMVLNDLVYNGHNIYIITARGTNSDMIDPTTDWVKDIFPMINGIVFTGHNKNKAIDKLNIDVVIDDNCKVINNILESQNINPYTILYSNETTPWNWKCNLPYTLKIDSLLDIPFIIEDIENSTLI